MTFDDKSSRKPAWPHCFTKRGNRFYASVRVSESLRGIVTTGRQTHIRVSLKTDREAEALRRFPLVYAEIKANIQRAQRQTDGRLKGAEEPVSSVAADAAWWREHFTGRGVDPANAMGEEDFNRAVWQTAGTPREVIDEDGVLREVYDPQSEQDAHDLRGLVTGDKVPVLSELGRFLADEPLSTRYASRRRRAAKALALWLQGRGHDNVATVSRYEAGLYAEHLATTCKSGATAGGLILALSAYWGWMVRKGVARENPWPGQVTRKRASIKSGDKRPFTDDEVAQLLAGETYSTLHDFMRIASLSGMRINEIGSLQVSDCSDGAFRIRKAKTSAGVRTVPIHDDLLPIIARRVNGKAAGDFLIEELKTRKDHPGDRAGKVSERFTAYRRGLGLDEREEGQTQSNIDFHSFRRWFITKAEQAGQPPHIIASTVGHSREGMTLGTYSAGPSRDQMREVVLSVRLPKGAEADKPGGARMGDGRWGGEGHTGRPPPEDSGGPASGLPHSGPRAAAPTPPSPPEAPPGVLVGPLGENGPR